MDLERYKRNRHGGIIDYARTHLDTFTERPLRAVDSLILSWASYLRLPEELAAARGPEGVRIAELHRAEYFEDYVRGVLQPEQGLALLAAMTASPRFRDVRLTRYTSRTDVDVEMQFAAMTFLLPDGAAYVAFRGTDSSLVGWKEDFNTSFECPVPSQVEAADYLTAVAADVDGGIIAGGHSKGGNLAVYAAATVAPEVRERVVRAYSHDGPGFLPEVLATSAFVEVAPKVCKTVPQSSVIGMLLEQQEGYRVVRSRRPMLWQHDPFTWEVDGEDLVYLDHLAPDALSIDRTVSTWLAGRSTEEREHFIDALYGVIGSTEALTVDELRADWVHGVRSAARAYSDLDPETRALIRETLRALRTSMGPLLPERLQRDLWRGSRATEAIEGAPGAQRDRPGRESGARHES